MLFYEKERAALEQQAIKRVPSVDLEIACSPVIAFPLTLEGIGRERMFEPVLVIKTEGGLYLIETPFQEQLPLGNPMNAEDVAPMRARFLVVKGWYDRYIDLLPHIDRDRVIAQFFDGVYLYLGPRIQYQKRGQEAPPDLLAQWEREVESRSRLRVKDPGQRSITAHWIRPTLAEMKERICIADPELLPDLLQKMPAAVIVDVRGKPADAKELRARYGARYFGQGSCWRPVKEELANPEEGFRQVRVLLEAGKWVVFYATANVSSDQDAPISHQARVRDYVITALEQLEAEVEAQRQAALTAITTRPKRTKERK